MVHKLLLDDFEVRGRDHSQRPDKPQSVNIDDIAIRIISVSPDNGATKKFAYTNYKLSHDFETCTLPHSERVVTKFSKSN